MEYSMAKMTDAELLGILNSDMKLWERASGGALTPERCKELGIPETTQGIVKELQAPMLGSEVWIFPANEKQYVEQFGPMVRSMIEERKHEAEERAARKRMQAEFEAQNPSPEADTDASGAGSEGGVPASPRPLQVAEQAAVPPHAPAATAGESFADRRDVLTGVYSELEDYIAQAVKNKKQVLKELAAVEAALEIMNAPEDDGAEQADVPTETTEPSSSS
jgi:hypothetical protein